MMTIGPPQQGQAFHALSTRPFLAASGAWLDRAGAGMPRSRRANAMLLARLPGEPPEGQLDGGEGKEGGQGFREVLEVLGE
jgi:hypothetical protein